jgi:hypothetical protein
MLLPHLTDAEVRDMVSPLTQPAAIVRWFKAQGFTVRKKPNGMPLISRSHFETMMAVNTATEEKKPDDLTVSPDVAAFMLRFKKDVSYAHGKTSNQQPARA